jgi:hypothetical protein
MVDARKVTRDQVIEAVQDGLQEAKQLYGLSYAVPQLDRVVSHVMLLLTGVAEDPIKAAAIAARSGTIPGEKRSPYR